MTAEPLAAHLHLVEQAPPPAPELIIPSLLDTVKVLHTREGGLLEAIIPLELIEQTDVPVDDRHVLELADSIRTEAARGVSEGQLSGVLIGEVPSLPKLLTIDGFHRTAAQYMLGREAIFGTIRPDSTMEEVIDLRILTANTHKSVRFSRMIDWVEQAWALSPWADQINSSQAFALTSVKTMNGKNLHLTPDEVGEIKHWVDEKCKQWHVAPGTVYMSLQVAKIADPALVRDVRERRGGHTLEHLTPQHLGVIARALPNEFAMQQLVAGVAKARSLTVPETRTIVTKIAAAEDLEEAIAMVEVFDKSLIQPTYSRSRAQELKNKKTQAEVAAEREKTKLLEAVMTSEVHGARLALTNALLRGEYSSPPVDADKDRPLTALYADEASRTKALGQRLTAKGIDKVYCAISDRANEVSAQLAAKMTAQYGVIKSQTAYAQRGALARIRHDLESGILGHQPPHTMHEIDNLILVTTRQEVEAIDTETLAQRGRPPTPIREIALDHTIIRDALATLGPDERHIVTLAALYNLPSKSVAQIAGSNETAVNQILIRIAQKLKLKASAN